MFKFYRSVLAAGVVALGLQACGDDVTVTNPPPAPPPGVSSVVVTPANATVGIGQTIQLASTVIADSGVTQALTWTSSTPTIAAVDGSGKVTGVAPGSTTIFATSVATPSVSSAVSITVTQAASGILSFTVSPTNISLTVGATFQPNYAVSTVAGVTATLTYASNNTAAATVNANGTITGVANGNAIITATATAGGQSQTATVGVNVGQGPSGVTSFTVVPSTASLAIGQTQQITSTVNCGTSSAPAACSPAIPVTYASLSPQVATVSSSGLITAVAPGTAVINATITNGGGTTTQAVAVTVGSAASISIQSINVGGTLGVPVNLANVVGQIDINLNLTAGSQPLDSLDVFIRQPCTVVSTACPSTAPGTFYLKRAAKQNYNNTIPSSGLVVLSVHTDNFTKVPATGVGLVDYLNGPTTVVSQLFPHNTTAGQVSNCQAIANNDPTCSSPLALVLNNVDGFAADITRPTAQAAAGVGGCTTDVGGSGVNSGSTYCGGPGTAGQTSVEIYPVIYNDNPNYPTGSALNRCNNLLGNGTGCISSVTYSLGNPLGYTGGPVPGGDCPFVTQIAQPFKTTYGTGTGTTACGYQNTTATRDNVVISNSIDGSNNGFMTVGTTSGPATPGGPVVYTMLIPNTVVLGSTPDSLRIDYAAPATVSAPVILGAEGYNWVNANYNFRPAGTVVTDAGVGPLQSSYSITATNSAGVAFPGVTSGAQLAETNTNCNPALAGCDGYTAFAVGTDLLGNTRNSSTASYFGVDKTAPVLRYSVTAAPSSFASSYAEGGAATVLDSTTYFVFQALPAAGTDDSIRIEALDNRSGLSRALETTNRFAQGGAAGTQTTVSTTNAANNFGVSTLDGYRAAPAFHITAGSTLPGYYTTTEFVIDKAGNPSGCPTAGTLIGLAGVADAVCSTAAPSTTANSNPAVPASPAGAAFPSSNENLYVRRTLALDPGQPSVTGVSPNNNYAGNSMQTFSLGAQDDLEVIDSRLRIQYPNLTQGDNAGTASPGLVWSYSLSSTFLSSTGSPNGNTCNGPTTSNRTAGSCGYGYFLPIGVKFDASIINPVVTGLGTTPAMTLDQFTLNVQETCIGAASGTTTAGMAVGPTTALPACGGNVPANGDPIPFNTAVAGFNALTSPNNIGVQVRDVFGSFNFNTVAGAASGVSAEFVSPILSATVGNPGGYTVHYYVPGAGSGCPLGGGPALPLTACVDGGINFRAEAAGSGGAVRIFRATEALSTTLPTFVRVDLFGLNAAGEWVFIQRCTVPSPIIPNTGPQSCGGGTINGTDNGLERYWLYTFSGIPTTGFTQFRAIGVNAAGFGLASTRIQ